ncbi:MAG: DUF3418 domain-containing protein, partial [Burkholderiaceae bacterium]
LVPVPEYVIGFCARHKDAAAQSEPLVDSIRTDARERHAVQAQLNDFRPEVVPKHLVMNFKLVDAHGRQIAVSRSLVQLRAVHGERAAGAFREAFKAVAGKVRVSESTALSSDGSKPSVGQEGENAGIENISDHPVVGNAPVPAAVEPVVGSNKNTAGNNNSDTESADLTIEGDSIQLDIGRRFTRWPVGQLPEILEILEPGTGVTMVGFPAFVDRDNAISIEVFDDQGEARVAHRSGVRRLLVIALRESFKSLFKNLTGFQNLVIAHARLGTDDELRAGMIDGILQRAVGDLGEPQSRQDFELLTTQVKPRLSLLGQELSRNLEHILDEYGTVTRKIQTVSAGAKENEVKSAVQDCREQLEGLVYSGFIGATPPAQFPHLSRYLKAIVMRLERVRADPGRDTKHRTNITELMTGYRRLIRDRRGLDDQQLENFRWLIEELRVSMFAQSLRTPTPVSLKRLNKMLFELRAQSGLG